MITRCARCCLIWSRPTIPLTASSTPPKASVHRWSHLSAMTLITLKLKKRNTLLSLYVCWKGVNLCLDRFCTPLCLSRYAACSLPTRLVLCCETLHWPLFYPNVCDKSLYHWLLILPFTKQFTSNFVLEYQKGLILYLSFAEHLQRSMIQVLLYLAKSAHEEKVATAKAFVLLERWIYIFFFLVP